MSNNADHYSQEYWINASKNIDPKTYKSQMFFEHIGMKTVLPLGLKVQLGVAFGYTFGEMKRYWGEDQVLGIDLHNYFHDSNIWSIDIKNLKVKLPCAYIENDIGSSAIPDSKHDRWIATQWGVQSLVPGGIMITNIGALINAPVEKYAEENNCEVIPMTIYDNLPWAQFLNTHTPHKTSGWCIIKRK